ncbi:MAG TPA: Mut7-C RNAse domain-containing protein [Candidatus Binatia bacterium]|nr:Mut7-C RNAse domain-containing protein [Candidatus Binatia bacterium]
MDPPRFAVDRMLGRLARWLRLLGFDAIYRADLPGAQLATLAAREGRVVLTRDRRLARARSRAPIVCLLEDRFRDQLRELDRVHPLAPSPDRPPRCAECNEPVVAVAPADVPASVPQYVRATQREFHRCPRCRRTYWPATHWQRMQAEVADLGLRSDAGDPPAPVTAT